MSAIESKTTGASPIRRLLITGANGYLGRSLCEVLSPDFDLLRMDVRSAPGPGYEIVGSVCDRATVDAACAQADAIVLAHMAPSRTAAYDWPDLCLDINVKGVALALEAAVRHGIRRIVLISSVSVVWGHAQGKTYLRRDLEPRPMETYGMTKALQEDVARFYHRIRGLEVAVLRPAYVIREDSMINKYGEARDNVTWQCVDPRDIARAVRGALLAKELGCDTFYLMAGPDAERHADIGHTRDRLGWTPVHRFAGLPVEII